LSLVSSGYFTLKNKTINTKPTTELIQVDITFSTNQTTGAVLMQKQQESTPDGILAWCYIMQILKVLSSEMDLVKSGLI
jgi:hypothetical protein